jgi:hypothetical protein
MAKSKATTSTMEHQFQPENKLKWKCSICQKEKKYHLPDSSFTQPQPPPQAPSIIGSNHAQTEIIGEKTESFVTAPVLTASRVTIPAPLAVPVTITPTVAPVSTTLSLGTDCPGTAGGDGQTLHWDNGDVYFGQFKNQLPHDRNGVWICHNKCKYEGEFIQGCFCGLGKYTDVDGTIHQGFWKDDFPLGQSVRYLPNGQRLVGNVKWISGDRPDDNGAFRKWIEFVCDSDLALSFHEVWYEGRRHWLPSHPSSIIETSTSSSSSNSDFWLMSCRNEMSALQEELTKALDKVRQLEKQNQVVCHTDSKHNTDRPTDRHSFSSIL